MLPGPSTCSITQHLPQHKLCLTQHVTARSPQAPFPGACKKAAGRSWWVSKQALPEGTAGIQKPKTAPRLPCTFMTCLYSADSGYLSKYSQTQPRANTRGIPPWPYPGAWTIIGVLWSPASRSSSAPPCGDKPPAQPLQHR